MATFKTYRFAVQIILLATNYYTIATNPTDTNPEQDSPLTSSCASCPCNVVPLVGQPGVVGPPGIAGPAGVPGVPGIGIQGQQGLTGPAGDPGIPGVPGQGLRGSKGEQGQPGEAGRDGERGPAGDRGPIGLTGQAGPMGPPGKLGPSGVKGASGIMGITGQKGVKGERGEIGIGEEIASSHTSAFTVYRRSRLTVTSGSQVITYEEEEFDIGDDMDHTTGIYTCPVAGVYYFSFSMWSNGGHSMHIRLQVNGVNKGRVKNDKGSRYMPQGAGIALSLSAGDRVQLKVYAETHIASGSNDDSFFSGFLLYNQ